MVWIDIEGVSGELLRQLERLNADLTEEIERANERIGAKVSGDAKRLLQSEVYSVPIPLRASADRRLGPSAAVRSKTTKGSRGQWRRTGNLLRQETYRVSLDGASVILFNNAEEALPRAALGMENPPNAAGRKAGEQRPQTEKPEAQRSKTKAVGNWQTRAVEANRRLIGQEYEAGVARALEKVGH
jgi:hypothetical protein